jgi:hypothetical protein
MGVKVDEAKRGVLQETIDIERFAIATSTSTRHLDTSTLLAAGLAFGTLMLMVFLSVRFLSGFG